MLNVKTLKETSKTLSVVFEKENENDVKKLKAILILLGYFNPLRKEMMDSKRVCEKVKEIKENCEFENIIFEIEELLK